MIVIHTEKTEIGWRAYTLNTNDGHTVSEIGESELKAVGNLIAGSLSRLGLPITIKRERPEPSTKDS